MDELCETLSDHRLIRIGFSDRSLNIATIINKATSQGWKEERFSEDFDFAFKGMSGVKIEKTVAWRIGLSY